jgi:hypothetical protein
MAEHFSLLRPERYLAEELLFIGGKIPARARG